MTRTTLSVGGIRHITKTDDDGASLVIQRLQNVEPILDYNKFLRGLGAKHYKGEDGNMWHYARVPTIFMEKWIREYGADVVLGGEDDTIIKLIERDYPAFKCGEFNLA
jgi:hypothetical protein